MIKNIIDQKINTINDYIQLVEIHFHLKDISMLRMEIKKLQALLRLVGFHSKPKELIESPVNSRTILAQSGKIRDLLLQVEKIKQSCKTKDIPVKYIEILHNEIKDRKLKYAEITFDKSKTKKEYVESITERLKKSHMRKYLSDRHEKINILIENNKWENTHFNAMRRLIKELLYNISNIEKNSSFQFKYPSTFVAKLTLTAEMQSDFYNNYIAINLLDNAETTQLPDKEKKTLQEIMTVWKSDKEKDKIKLIESIKNIAYKK